MERLIPVGIILLIIGIILIFLGSLGLNKEKTSVKAAGGIFIGPFPIFGFFTDRKMFYLLIALAVLFFIFSFIFSRIK